MSLIITNLIINNNMKTTTMKSLFGKALIAGSLLALPVSTYALDGSSHTSLSIHRDGIIRVLGAQVTSITGNIINAFATFKNSTINFTVATNATTSVASHINGTASTSLSGLAVGDKINVTGTLGTVGSVLGVNAIKVKEVAPKATSTSTVRIKTGAVQSVNTANGTFVITSDNKTVTVQTNSATAFIMATGAGSLANLSVNTKVAVSGTLSADGTILTASKVITKPVVNENWKKEWKQFFKNHSSHKGNDNHR